MFKTRLTIRAIMTFIVIFGLVLNVAFYLWQAMNGD
jgi:hypothetical protein